MRLSQRPSPDRRAAIILGASAVAMAFAGRAAAAELYGVRQDGKEVAPGEIGGWRLVYFGYTRCPDVCPLSLQSMASALDALGPIGQRITPVFVTVDPERDTPAAMADYVAFFSPRFVALTPSAEQLASLAREWRVTYKRVDLQGRDGYSIDHTATIFFVAPWGSTIGRFPHDLDARALADRIRAAMLKS